MTLLRFPKRGAPVKQFDSKEGYGIKVSTYGSDPAMTVEIFSPDGRRIAVLEADIRETVIREDRDGQKA
jgi:hypothetical protein